MGVRITGLGGAIFAIIALAIGGFIQNRVWPLEKAIRDYPALARQHGRRILSRGPYIAVTSALMTFCVALFLACIGLNVWAVIQLVQKA